MNRKLQNIVIVLLTIALAGCASMVVPKPGAITLEAAMQSVGTGLRQMRVAEEELRTGLIADEVQVTFNISANGEQAGKLYVEVTPIPTNPPTGGRAGGELSSSYTAQRGNQITVKFKNIMTASNKDTLCKDIKAVEELVKIIKGEGFDNMFFYAPLHPGGQPQGPFFTPQFQGK